MSEIAQYERYIRVKHIEAKTYQSRKESETNELELPRVRTPPDLSITLLSFSNSDNILLKVSLKISLY